MEIGKKGKDSIGVTAEAVGPKVPVGSGMLGSSYHGKDGLPMALWSWELKAGTICFVASRLLECLVFLKPARLKYSVY